MAVWWRVLHENWQQVGVGKENKTFSGDTFWVISTNSRRLTYPKLNINLKFSCHKIHLFRFQEAVRLYSIFKVL